MRADRAFAFLISFLLIWGVAYLFISPFTRKPGRAATYSAIIAVCWCGYALWLWGPILLG